ncbi:MAG: hypothetical protein U0531_09160 [Dehalococcoidia bacterium]
MESVAELAARVARSAAVAGASCLRTVASTSCIAAISPYLNRAKALGDALINADASVRRLKGPGRPITTLDDRLGVLAAMSCVDHVIAFEQDTPADLIRIVRPDPIKGGDYRRETLPERCWWNRRCADSPVRGPLHDWYHLRIRAGSKTWPGRLGWAWMSGLAGETGHDLG